MKQTTAKRTVFIVSKEALNGLAKAPPDLHKWTSPRGPLDLPADIYDDDVLFIDDGYRRDLIPILGILHVGGGHEMDGSSQCRGGRSGVAN